MSLGNETTAPYLRAIIFASGTCRIETKGAKSTGRSRLMPIKRTFLNLLCALHHVCHSVEMRASFHDEIIDRLTLTPVVYHYPPCETPDPARGFRHRSHPRLYFASCFSLSYGARFIIAEAMICKMSPPFDLRQSLANADGAAFIKCTN